MAWISIENLGLYHQKLKDWINKNIHAKNVIQDDNNKFVSTEQIKNWNGKLTQVVNLETELPVGHNTITVPSSYTITDTTVIWLFIDGIKQTKNKHFNINKDTNSLILTETYQSSVEIRSNHFCIEEDFIK